MVNIEKLEAQYLEENLESERVQDHFLDLKYIRDHLDTKLRIEIPSKHIGSSGYQLVKGKAILSNGPEDPGKMEVDCYVASAHWRNLTIQGDTVNILDQLDKLLPTFTRLITFQNGIQNRKRDLKTMGALILGNLSPERPLCIGLHNPTNGKWFGLHADLTRLWDEWTLNPYSMLMTRQFFATLVDLLPNLKYIPRWAHLAHSEGGLIARELLVNSRYPFTPTQVSFIKYNINAYTYGAVMPLPKEVLTNSVNTYSKDDVLVRVFGKNFLDKVPEPPNTESEDDELMPNIYYKKDPSYYAKLEEHRNKYYITKYPHLCKENGCEIVVVDSINPSLTPIAGDHFFEGETYKSALKSNIKKWYLGNEDEL